MKSISSQKNRHIKPLQWALLVALVIAGSAIAYLLLMSTGASKSDVNLNPPTSDQIDAGNATKEQTVNGDVVKPGVGNQPSTEARQSIPITITATNQNGDMLQVRTLISSIADSGSCTLTITQGSKIITKQAGLQAQANSSTCKGFDVPISELSKGTYSLRIDVLIGSSSGSVTREGKIE